MNTSKFQLSRFGRLLWLALVAFLLHPAAFAIEQKFDVLQIGTKTYRNVTVTTKARSYVFILHADGMTNLKVADLPDDLRQKLGYNDLPQKTPSKGLASAWSKKALPTLKLPQLESLEQNWRAHLPASLSATTPNPRLMVLAAGVGFLVFLCFCGCCRLLCLKTGNDPGILIWLPLFQLFPLLRAAGMSPLWFLACLVPGLNLLAQIVWCVKISKACRKSGWFGVLLLLPLLNVFAFLHLALAGAGKEERVVEMMRLEMA